MPLRRHAGVEAALELAACAAPSAWRPWPGAARRPRPGEKPATATAISISCSWKSGTPSVRAQDRLEARVQVGDRLVAATPAHVGVDGVALDGAGADERHLDHQVVEAARLHARQRRHLRARLDLEDPDGVGLAEQVVDGVLLGQRAEVERRRRGTRATWSTARCSASSMPEAQQVELHEADRRAVVLVPLQHGAPGHAPPLDRADLDHRPVAQHHAGRVDAEVSRPIEQLRSPWSSTISGTSSRHRGHARAVHLVAQLVGLPPRSTRRPAPRRAAPSAAGT